MAAARDILLIGGLVAIVAGVAVIHWPAAMIAAGVILTLPAIVEWATGGRADAAESPDGDTPPGR